MTEDQAAEMIALLRKLVDLHDKTKRVKKAEPRAVSELDMKRAEATMRRLGITAKKR